MKNCDVEIGDSVFLACGKEKEIEKNSINSKSKNW